MSERRSSRFGGGRERPKSGIAGFVGLAFTVISFVFLFQMVGILPRFSLGDNPPTAADNETQARLVEQVTTKSIHEQQLAVAKLQQSQLVAAYEDLTRTIDAWERELASWEQQGPPLLASDDGKRIASDIEQAKRYRGVSTAVRPGKKEITAARRAAEDLIAPIRKALKDPQDASKPDAGFAASMQGLQTEAVRARDGYREAVDAVASMLDAVKQKTPAGETLEAVLGRLDKEEAGRRAALIDAAVQKEKDDGANRIAQARVALEKAIHDKDAGDIRLQAERKNLEAQLAAAKAADEEKVLAREREQDAIRLRDLAEVKRQGDLKTGSVWKGTFYDHGAPFPNATMTIDNRTGDTMNGRIEYTSPKGEETVIMFSATYKQPWITLTPIRGLPPSNIFQCTYYPSQGIITGQETNTASFSFRLVPEKPQRARRD